MLGSSKINSIAAGEFLNRNTWLTQSRFLLHSNEVCVGSQGILFTSVLITAELHQPQRDYLTAKTRTITLWPSNIPGTPRLSITILKQQQALLTVYMSTNTSPPDKFAVADRGGDRICTEGDTAVEPVLQRVTGGTAGGGAGGKEAGAGAEAVDMEAMSSKRLSITEEA